MSLGDLVKNHLTGETGLLVSDLRSPSDSNGPIEVPTPDGRTLKINLTFTGPDFYSVLTSGVIRDWLPDEIELVAAAADPDP